MSQRGGNLIYYIFALFFILRKTFFYCLLSLIHPFYLATQKSFSCFLYEIKKRKDFLNQKLSYGFLLFIVYLFNFFS
jgi:hypothetical protein